jgi:hypothetical protein
MAVEIVESGYCAAGTIMIDEEEIGFGNVDGVDVV